MGCCAAQYRPLLTQSGRFAVGRPDVGVCLGVKRIDIETADVSPSEHQSVSRAVRKAELEIRINIVLLVFALTFQL